MPVLMLTTTGRKSGQPPHHDAHHPAPGRREDHARRVERRRRPQPGLVPQPPRRPSRGGHDARDGEADDRRTWRTPTEKAQLWPRIIADHDELRRATSERPTATSPSSCSSPDRGLDQGPAPHRPHGGDARAATRSRSRPCASRSPRSPRPKWRARRPSSSRTTRSSTCCGVRCKQARRGGRALRAGASRRARRRASARRPRCSTATSPPRWTTRRSRRSSPKRSRPRAPTGQRAASAMGQVIKAVRARVGADASGGRVAAAVKAALGES